MPATRARRLRATSSKSASPAPIIPAGQLRRIFEITGVRADHQGAAAERIQAAVVVLPRSEPRKRPLRRRLLKKVAELSKGLRSQIELLDEEEEVVIGYIAFSNLDDDDDECYLQELKWRLEQLAAACHFRAAPAFRRPSNRPKGSFQYKPLRAFIYNLQIAVEKIGEGKLSLSQKISKKNSPHLEFVNQGRLREVLEILRPYIPDVIPSPLPSQITLIRILRDARHRDEGPPSPQKKNQKVGPSARLSRTS